PRSYGGFQFPFSRGLGSPRAMSERLEPGSVATLALSSTPVFRVEFPDHNIPPTAQLYWRGGVLWRGEGLTWVRGGLLGGETSLKQTPRPPHPPPNILGPP